MAGPLKNARREKLAQLLAKGMTQTEAYAQAGWKRHTSNAARTCNRDDVRARVQELQERAAERVVVSREWVLERLKTNVDRCMQFESVIDGEGNDTGVFKHEPHAANRALELIGKELGMFAERFEHRVQSEIQSMLSAASKKLPADVYEQLLAFLRAEVGLPALAGGGEPEGVGGS